MEQIGYYKNIEFNNTIIYYLDYIMIINSKRLFILTMIIFIFGTFYLAIFNTTLYADGLFYLGLFMGKENFLIFRASALLLQHIPFYFLKIAKINYFQINFIL